LTGLNRIPLIGFLGGVTPLLLEKTKIGLFFLIHNLRAGGSERMLLELIKRLPRDKYQISLCTMFSEGELVEEALKTNAKLYCLNMKRGALNIIPCLKLYKLLKQQKVDILHSWLFYANLLGRVIGKFAHVKVIFSSQRSIDDWRKFHHSFLDKLTSYLATAIISNSRAGRLRLIHRERINPKKIHTVYNGIDEKEFEIAVDTEAIKQKYQLFNFSKIVGTVASLRSVKGHKYLIKAMSKLLTEMPEAVLLLIGEGPLKAELIHQCETLRILEHVQFLGYKERTEVIKLLFIMDIFVLPSLYEGLPNAVLEAQACGIPAIATTVGGIPELIENGKTGVLVTAQDVDALYTAMLRLLKSDQLRFNLSQTAKADLKKKFSMEKMVWETECLYEKYLL